MRILETGINMFLLEVKSAFPFDGRFGNIYQNIYIRASLVAQMIKHPPAIQKTWVQSLGGENPLEKEMATHSSILAWRISWTEEPGGLQSMGSKRVGHDWATNTHFNLIYKLERIYSFIPQVFKHFLSAKHYSRSCGFSHGENKFPYGSSFMK